MDIWMIIRSSHTSLDRFLYFIFFDYIVKSLSPNFGNTDAPQRVFDLVMIY
jgi:hypothetical protein